MLIKPGHIRTGNQQKDNSSIEALKPLLSKRILYLWFLMAGVAVFIQALTVSFLPGINNDEIQITEYGRLILNPNSNWSANWLVQKEKPLFLWTYIGPLISELSYLMGNATGEGPRFASMLGGFLAATITLLWLRARNVTAWAAFLLSLVYLIDPLFVLSQRTARLDSWVFAFCTLSCLILRVAAQGNDLPKQNRKKNLPLVWSGFCAAFAAFVWPSAVLLYPLIICELYNYLKSERSKDDNWFYYTRNCSVFLCSIFFCGLLLLLPIWNTLPFLLQDLKQMLQLNVRSSNSTGSQLSQLVSYQPYVKLIKAFAKTFTPFLPILALYGGISRFRKPEVVATMLTVLFIGFTLVYHFRVLYLIPYLIVLSSGMFQKEQPNPINKSFRLFPMLLLFFAVAWAIGVSLVARTVIGFREKASMSRSNLTSAASVIGQTGGKVFMDITYEFYYIGRSLGWKIYIPYTQYDYDPMGDWHRRLDYEQTDQFHRLLQDMDYAIFLKSDIKDHQKAILESCGLKSLATIEATPLRKMGRNQPKHSRMKSILMSFLVGKDSYGPYVLYGRRP